MNNRSIITLACLPVSLSNLFVDQLSNDHALERDNRPTRPV